MTSRYDNRRVLKNDLEEYENILDDRGVKQIFQYGTRFMKFPTVDEIKNLTRAWAIDTISLLQSFTVIQSTGGSLLIITRSLPRLI